MKIIFPFALCCLGFLALFGVFGFLSETPTLQTFPAALNFPQKQESKTLTLLFVGDIMLDRGVAWKINQNPPTGGGGDWRWPFLQISTTLQEADLAVGNLESQISDKGRNVGSMYSFRANPQSIQGLVYAGFDVLSVANNHSFDYTREAFEDSLQRIAESGMSYAGGGFSRNEAYGLLIKETRNTKIGFLAYTNSGAPGWSANENRGGIAWVDWSSMDAIIQDIQNAKSQVDILAVSIHAGEEYQPKPNEFQKAFAQAAIEAGANLIVGHHSHVVQPFEHYKDGWIAYSLGNFVFDQDFSEETMAGAILKIVVENKKIKEVSLLSTRLTPSYQVHLTE